MKATGSANKVDSERSRTKPLVNKNQQKSSSVGKAVRNSDKSVDSRSTPQRPTQKPIPRSSNSTNSGNSFYLSRGFRNADDEVSNTRDLEDQQPTTPSGPYPHQFSFPNSYVNPAPPLLIYPQISNPSLVPFPVPQLPPQPYVYSQYPIPPSYPFPGPYQYPNYNFDPYTLPYAYEPPPLAIAEYKIALHQSLEESALEEKLRRADEEALQKALQLSVDEQDLRIMSFDKADEEALHHALIRSIYDQGGLEVGSTLVDPGLNAEDDELERKLAMEQANQNALNSGLTRSLYNIHGSNDSGTVVALSSTSDGHLKLETVPAISPDSAEIVESQTNELRPRRSFTLPRDFHPVFVRNTDEEKDDRVTH